MSLDLGRTWFGIAGALGMLAGCATDEARPIGNTDPTYGAGAAARPVASIGVSSLSGTRWVGSAEGIAENARPRLEFVGAGRISGYSGCNMLSGTWRTEGAEVKLGAIAMTKRMCLGPEAQVEQRVVAAMGDGTTVRREGDRLILTSPGGASFEFVAAK